MSRTTTKAAISLLAAMMIPVAANAASITFPLDGGEGSTTFTTTVGGVTLTVDNPSGGPITALPNFLLTGNNYDGFMKGFSFHFDADVELTGYSIGSVNLPTGAFFDLEGPNGDALNNSIESTGTFAPSTTFFLQAGQVATLISSFPNANGYVELLSFDVNASQTPEPESWILVGGAFSGLLLLRFRRGHRPQIE